MARSLVVSRVGRFIPVLLGAAWMILLISNGARADDDPAVRQAATQARGIHSANVIYSQSQNTRFSDDISELVRNNFFTPAYALSPLSKKQLPDGYDDWPHDQQDNWLRQNASYVLIPGLTDDTNAKTAAVFLRPDDSNASGMAVAFNDNHTEWLSKDKARQLIENQTGMTLEQLIARQANFRLPAWLFTQPDAFELTEKIILNPDGSGKATFEINVIPKDVLFRPDAAAANKRRGATIRELSQYIYGVGIEVQVGFYLGYGVDALKDLSCKITDDDHIHIAGTAYFKNIDKWSVGSLARKDITMAWVKDPAGGMTLAVDVLPRQSVLGPAQSLTGEAIDRLIAGARARWDGMKRDQETVLGSTKINLTYLLPGQPDKMAIFQAMPGGVGLTIEGRKFPDMIERWLDNETGLKAAIKASQNWIGPERLMAPDHDVVYQAIFGQKGPISVHVGGDLKPKFDYAAEVAAAKAAAAEEMKKQQKKPAQKR